MPSQQVTREALHFRRIDMKGWRRSDGLFEVEGQLTDSKASHFVPRSGGKEVRAGDPIHDMVVRLVFDQDLWVRGVETASQAYPYAQCPEGGRALQALVGLRMTSGWGREVRSRIGGALSCTHLVEMLVPMATVAHQSLSYLIGTRPERLDAEGRPLKIDSCYAYAAERDLVKMHWPEYHRASTDDEQGNAA